MKPQNFEESVVWYYILLTYVLFFLGAQFIAAPLMAWALFLYVLKKLWSQNETTPLEERIQIPVGVWIWIVGMLTVAVALVIGHVNLDMGLTRIIKSFINFFLRTWSLLAIFPLIGCLHIRPRLIYRAICILAIQSLILLPFVYVLQFGGVEAPLYTSSLLARIGGIDERYYAITLFFMEGSSYRLGMFAPWAPALALVASVHFWLAYSEENTILRWIALVTNVVLIVESQSRLGLVFIICSPFLRIALTNLAKPMIQIMLGVSSFLVGLFSANLIILAKDFKEYFDSQREASSRVRETLARMAIYGWKESPIWGHSLKSEGPELTRGMPIGSHHTWFGVLYTHGIVGFVGLLIPLVYSFFDILIKAQRNEIAKTGLMVLLAMIAFSFGENLEGLAYLYWPGLVFLGIALKQKIEVSENEQAPDKQLGQSA